VIRPRLAAALAAALVAVPIVSSTPSAGAVAQDLAVSATSGAARSAIEVSSASCVDEPDGSIWRYLSVRMVSGAPGSERLAAAGSNAAGEPVHLVIPDWIDPADPAQIRAQCLEFDPAEESDDGLLTPTVVAFDPVDVDVLDPTEPAVQSFVASRTSLAVGQGFQGDLSGCFLPGDLRAAAVEVLDGSDLSGATGRGVLASDAELTGESISLPVLLNDSGTSIGWSSSDGQRPVIDLVEEHPTTLAPGPHVAFPYCIALDGDAVSYLFFPPVALDVTGTSPTADIDLTVEPGTRDATLAGECDLGAVAGTFSGLDIEHDPFSLGVLRSGASDGVVAASVLRPQPTTHGDGPSPRTITGDDFSTTPFEATTDATGAWQATDVADFELGAIRAFAACGDPFGDGFTYDAQIAVVDVAPPPSTTTTTVTTTTAPAPVPPPADRIVGLPTYAG